MQVSGAHQTVSATLASPEVAEALEVSVGSALLSIRRVVRDTEDDGVGDVAAEVGVPEREALGAG